MLRPVYYKTDQYTGYQQALDDFGIAELLAKLSNHCQQQEPESLAALLISQLTQSIDTELIANYLSVLALSLAEGIAHHDLLPLLNTQKFVLASVDLPVDFPDTAQTPRFLYGDKLRWRGNDSDWGIAIGRFYSFAPHLGCWTWCYMIWLSKDSPSAAWTSADIAWEDDLEPLEGTQVL